MWFWVMAQAKDGVDMEAIAARRKQWVSEGKDQQVRQLCRSAQRFVVAGSAPTRVFWLLDADDPRVVQLITDHFGELWTIDTRVVAPQPIAEAVGAGKPLATGQQVESSPRRSQERGSREP